MADVEATTFHSMIQFPTHSKYFQDSSREQR